MNKLIYKTYKCVSCGKSCRAWIESLCYKKKLCPKCLDKEVPVKGGKNHAKSN